MQNAVHWRFQTRKIPNIGRAMAKLVFLSVNFKENNLWVGYLKCLNGKVTYLYAPGDLLFRNLH